MVTADGFRLSVAGAKVSNDKQLATVIPARAMGMLSAFQSGDLCIYASEKGDLNTVVFSNGDLDIASQAIMGKYPDYRQIIPADTGTRMTVNRADLIRACKVVNVFAKSAANVVIFDVDSNQLILTGEASEVGDGRSELDIELSGGALKIGFNCTYMLETLASMDCEKVVVGMKDNSAPATVRPADGEDHLCVIMPMHFTDPKMTQK
jgi:DNA polymerase-3 subunit beta